MWTKMWTLNAINLKILSNFNDLPHYNGRGRWIIMKIIYLL